MLKFVIIVTWGLTGQAMKYSTVRNTMRHEYSVVGAPNQYRSFAFCIIDTAVHIQVLLNIQPRASRLVLEENSH